MKCLIIAIDDRKVKGMTAAARAAGMEITVLTVGDEALAQHLAQTGCDEVIALALEDGFSAEGYAPEVARIACEEAPQLVLANDSARARMLLACTAAALSAVCMDGVHSVSIDEGALCITREVIGGATRELLRSAGPVAGIFVGPETECEGAVAPVRSCSASPLNVRIVDTRQDEDAGLESAERIVGVGMGIGAEGFEAAKTLARVIEAELACTLPVCDDRHWMPSSRVLGSSHNQSSPQLYIAIGISGSPNHTSGVRDAKVKVAINKDPEAPIFKFVDYGIVGDAADIVPLLTVALD